MVERARAASTLAPNSPSAASTTATRLELDGPESRIGITNRAPIRTGPSTVAMMNWRVRTRSRNSRLATTQALRMTADHVDNIIQQAGPWTGIIDRHRPGGSGTHLGDEDRLERRLHDLE